MHVKHYKKNIMIWPMLTKNTKLLSLMTILLFPRKWAAQKNKKQGRFTEEKLIFKICWKGNRAIMVYLSSK